jgi:hypothetical protein
MTTPSKAFVFGLLGGCVAAGFATRARFGVSMSMESKRSSRSNLSRKDKSNNLVLVAVQNQKPAPTFFAVSSLLTPEEEHLFTTPNPFIYIDLA